MNLTEQKCVPCEGDVKPMNKEQVGELIKMVTGWEADDDAKKISKNFSFKDFKEALEFVNKVGVVAESEGHHPDIHLVNYKNVSIELWTHAIGGLSQNDFIVAAKIDQQK